MASFRDIEFEKESKKKKLEKSKTTTPNFIYSNPFQTYKQYNTERNKSKIKINESKDTNRVTDSGQFRLLPNNESLPVDEDVDSHQPTRIEQPELQINNNHFLENNKIPQKVEVKHISPKPELLSGNGVVGSHSNLKKSYQHDTHKKIYEYIKNNEKIKISKEDGNFMKRMLLDIYVRQSKEDRINNYLEQTKVKLGEGELVKTFNRLIEDANRRMEAFDNMDMMKQFLDEKVSFKKYSQYDWDRVYNERYIFLIQIYGSTHKQSEGD
jgi:hypothetical protein